MVTFGIRPILSGLLEINLYIGAHEADGLIPLTLEAHRVAARDALAGRIVGELRNSLVGIVEVECFG
jgi:hypothetical protein